MAVIEKGEIRERGSRLCFCCMGTARTVCQLEQIDGSDRMTDKELRGLSRRDLLELLVAKEKENQQLRQELEQARAELNKRQIDVAKTGTMAEAALLLNGIFDAADRAARQYLENIKLRAEGTTK